jgi:hypothetical protein
MSYLTYYFISESEDREKNTQYLAQVWDAQDNEVDSFYSYSLEECQSWLEKNYPLAEEI